MSDDAHSVFAALCHLASVRTALGKWKSARAAYRDAVRRLDPNDVDQLWRIAIAAAHVHAVRYTARGLALRSGGDLERAERAPLSAINEAANRDLLLIPEPVRASYNWVRVAEAQVSDGETDEAADAGAAEAVLAEWRDLRTAANAAGATA